MAIRFIPSGSVVSLKDQKPHEALLISLLKQIRSGVHRVELQIEQITEEPIDTDDQILK